MGFPPDDPRQMPHQGALLCQDWPGPRRHRGEIPHDHYFAADDVGEGARLLGTIAFHFACYGAGTPRLDDFPGNSLRIADVVAPRPFVSRLPRRLLGHPRGGVLAVIGHVERAWGYSIRPAGLGNRLLPFRNLLGRVLRGDPVGLATKDFSDRYAASTMRILNLTTGTNPGPKPREAEMKALWVERNDAQNYVLLGDPAVRLRVEAMT